MQTLHIKRLRAGAVVPGRATAGSAGYDLAACLDAAVVIPPGERRAIPTGLAIAIPDAGIAAFVFGRSGLGVKYGVVPANAVGVIDSDYRGEITVGLANQGEEAFIVEPGDRIAQLVFMPVLTPELAETDELADTERGTGGFGSTGR